MNNSTPAGSWFLETNDTLLELTIQEFVNGYFGFITYENGFKEIISNITWNPQSRSLEFWWDSVRRWCCAYAEEDVSSEPAATPDRETDADAVDDAAQYDTAHYDTAHYDADQYDEDLYELAAALAPVFPGLPRDGGPTGAKFGDFLFSFSEVGPCCRLDNDGRRWDQGHSAFNDEMSAGRHEKGRRCA